MKKVYKATEFQSPTGYWHAGDYSDFVHHSSDWYVPARILDMSLTDYIKMLVDKYHIVLDSYTEYPDGRAPLLLYHWENYADCHKWTLMVNREAKKRNFCL